MALQRLSTSSSQNQPRGGLFPYFSPPPARAISPPAGSCLHPRVLAFLRFLRTMRAPVSSAPSHPVRPLRPSRLPIPDPRFPNVWGFLQEVFSRPRMGFPPAWAARALFLPASATVPPGSLHAPTLARPRRAPTLHGRPRPPTPRSALPGGFVPLFLRFARPTLTMRLPAASPSAPAVGRSDSSTPRLVDSSASLTCKRVFL
jgi:hypothetical protein